MKHFLLISLFAITLAMPGHAQQPAQTLYLTELGNIPLIPQASLVEDSSMVFDKPSGRIAQVQLVSRQPVETIMAYYAKTLPPLGWKAVSDTLFEREQETLSFDAQRDGDESVILIRLTPKEQPE